MDYSTLYQILAQAGEDNQKASPYAGFNDTIGQIGNTAIQLGAKNGDYKTGIIGALLSGILGGAGQSLSDSWVADKNDQASGLLNDAISGKTISRPDGMAPSVFNKINTGAGIWGLQQQAASQQAEQQSKQKLGEIAATAIAANPDRAPEILQSLGLSGGGQVSNEARPLTRETAAPELQQEAQQEQPQRVSILDAIGIPQADFRERENSGKEIDKQIAELNAKNSEKAELQSKLWAGFEGSGETGGLLGGGRDLASKLLASTGYSPDQAAKQAAQEQFGAAQKRAALSIKPAGSGATSDKDLALYLASVAGPDKLPAANKAMLQEGDIQLQRNQELAQLLQEAKSTGKSANVVNQLFSKYQSEVPPTDASSFSDWVNSKQGGGGDTGDFFTPGSQASEPKGLVANEPAKIDPKQAEIQALLGNPTTKEQKALRAGTGQVINSIPAIGDELFGYGGAAADFLSGKGNTIDQRLQQARDWGKAAQKTAPITSTIGSLGGALTVPIPGIGASASFATKAAKTAAQGAAVSGAYGFGQGEGGLENRLQSAKSGAKLGAALGGGLSLVGSGVGAVAARTKAAAPAVLEKGLGVGYGEKVKGLNKIPLYADDAGNLVTREELGSAAIVQAPIQEQVQTLKNAGIFKGMPNDAQGIKIHIEQQKSVIGEQIGALSKEADEALGAVQIPVELEKTKKFIDSYRGETSKPLRKEVTSVISDYYKEPGSGFLKLAKFTDKIQKETNFESLTKSEQTLLKKAISADLKTSSEKAFDAAFPARAGEYKSVNELYGALSSIGKTVNKKIAKGDLGLMGHLSGGSLPTTALTGLGGALAGSPAGLVGGAAVGGSLIAGRAAKNAIETNFPTTVSRAYEKIAPALANSAKGINKASTIAPALAGSLNLKEQAPTDFSRTKKPASLKVEPKQTKADKVFDALLDSIKKVESNGNPKAVSHAGAQGAYQFMPKTAKAYGLKDPFNEKQSRKAATALIQDEFNALGSMPLALAAYNAGRPAVEKAIKKAGSRDWMQVSKYLPTETRNYVPKIEAVFAKLTRSA